MPGRDEGARYNSVMRMESCLIGPGWRGHFGEVVQQGGVFWAQWTDLLSFPPGVVSRFLARQYRWRDGGEEGGIGPSLSGVLKR